MLLRSIGAMTDSTTNNIASDFTQSFDNVPGYVQPKTSSAKGFARKFCRRNISAIESRIVPDIDIRFSPYPNAS